MGGMQGFGGRCAVDPDEPPFARAVGGPGLRAWRCCRCAAVGHATSTPSATPSSACTRVDYLADGYYGRWLQRAEIAADRQRASSPPARSRPGPASCAARTSRSRPTPEPHKPDYTPTAAGSLRAGRRSRRRSRSATGCATKDMQPAGHTRLPALRARPDRATVDARSSPAHVLPDTHAALPGRERPARLHRARSTPRELWGAGRRAVHPARIDLFESYLEPAP